MQIQAYQINAQGQRDYSRVEQEQIRAEIHPRDANASSNAENSSSDSTRNQRANAGLTYSAEGETPQETFYFPPAPVMISTASSPLTEKGMEISHEDRLRLEIISGLHEAMTGKSLKVKVGLATPSEESGSTATSQQLTQTEVAELNLGREAPSTSIELFRSYSAKESETTRYSAQGDILTTDGKRIQLDMYLEMSRSVETNQRLQMTMGGRLHDPLVINFDGGSAELRNARYEFDLDANGEVELIPGLRGDRAFIALDKNNDGMINDGSELFGATTGDGFAELAAYDTDGNGFIDEGDEVYDQLKLWIPTADGGQLYDMSSRDVGAIYVSGTSTEFSVSSGFTENRLGVIRSTSFFLSESGGSGTVQHVDLSI